MSREAFYTYLRRLLGRGFTQAEVDDLEAHIDAMIAAGHGRDGTQALIRWHTGRPA